MRFKRILSYSLVSILITVIGVFSYLYIKSVEVTKVTLKCTEKLVLFKDQPTRSEYFRITKKLFDETPVSFLISHPDTTNKNLEPNIIGVYETSSKVNNIQFKRKYTFPEYYLFITDSDDVDHCKGCGVETIQTVTYIKRDNLETETTFIGDQTVLSSGKCEIVNNDLFDKDWKLKMDQIKKDRKI